MTDEKYNALLRMKRRARNRTSPAEQDLRVQTLYLRGQREVLDEVRQQTSLLEEQAQNSERTAEAQERIARNSTILVWIVVAFIVLDAIATVFL